ncbi:MAG: RidA family protein [Balneolales bacterium]
MKSKKIIHTANAPEAIGPYNQAIVYNDTVYCSGQIAMDPQNGELINGGIQEQVQQVMLNLEAILLAAGTGFEKVIKCSIFLSDLENFKVVNEVYGKYFVQNQPARETMAVKSLPKNAMVEISCIAHL